MKAVYMKEPFSIEVKDVEEKKPKIGDALLKIHAAGICGSDIGAFRGTNGLVTYPRVIGHELSGEILSISPNNKKGLKVGDRVVVDPYIYCGHCYPCSLGRTNCCTDLKVLGVHLDGGMVEKFIHPEDMLVKIPEGMSWELAAMAEPLTISLHGIHRLQVKAGEHVAIFGAGTIGILAAMVAKVYGAEPIVIDLVKERLEFVEKLGIKYTVNLNTDNLISKINEITNGRMCECVMEASGANAAIRSALDIVSHAGRVVFTGWPKKETQLPTDMITKKEVDIRGARTSAGEFEEALDLINTGKIKIAEILTKTVSVDEAPAVLRDIEKNPGNYLKVVVKF